MPHWRPTFTAVPLGANAPRRVDGAILPLTWRDFRVAQEIASIRLILWVHPGMPDRTLACFQASTKGSA